MSTPRSDADQLSRAPIKVTLGAREYEVPTLRMLDAHKWRKKLVDKLSEVVNVADFNLEITSSRSAAASQLKSQLIREPEILIDLVFDYAGESLNREEIEKEATDEQLVAAFAAVMQVAYPFLPSLAMAKTAAMAQTRNPPATAKFTN